MKYIIIHVLDMKLFITYKYSPFALKITWQCSYL